MKLVKVYRINRTVGERHGYCDGFALTATQTKAHIERRSKELKTQFPGQYVQLWTEIMWMTPAGADAAVNQ